MFGTALHFELAYKNILVEFEVFLMVVWWTIISSAKKHKPTKKAFRRSRTLEDRTWNSLFSCYSEIPSTSTIPWFVKGENFSEKRKKCKIFGKLTDRGGKLGWSWLLKLRDLVVPEADEEKWTHSIHPPRLGQHFSWHSARQNCLASGQCSIWSCNLCFVKCVVNIYVIKSFKMIRFFPRT